MRLVVSKRRSDKREQLSRDRVARAALAMVDKEGADAFSMRRLAESLGAGTMTLYGHFSSKRELLDAVIDVAVSERTLPELTGTWREQTVQLISFTREVFARHPAVVDIWSRQPVLGAGGLVWVEAGLGILDEAGFEPEEAAVAFRTVITYTYGFELFSGSRSTTAAREGTRRALESLPADRFPRLVDNAGPFAAAMGSTEAFDYGLQRILDGLEASLVRG